MDARIPKLIFFDQFSEIYQAIISGNHEKFKEWISNITDIKYYKIAYELAESVENEVKTQLLRLVEQDKGKKEILENQLKEYQKELKKLKSEQEKMLQSIDDIELKSKIQKIRAEYDKIEAVSYTHLTLPTN